MYQLLVHQTTPVNKRRKRKQLDPVLARDLRRDLTALDALGPRMMRITKLQQRLVDTEMALGSDLMVAAYEGYAYLKVAGKGEGLDQLRKMMGERFNHGPRSESEAPTPAE